MALVKCGDCGRSVSTKAQACPHCGAMRSSGLGVRVFALAIAMAALGFYGNMKWNEWQLLHADSGLSKAADTDAAKAAAKLTPKKKEEYVQRATAGARQLKKSIANPQQAKLESVLVVEGSGTVCYEYRALNSFGGMTPGRAVMLQEGGRFFGPDSDGLSGIWSKECHQKKGAELVAGINWFGL
jgi:hypothetical protein